MPNILIRPDDEPGAYKEVNLQLPEPIYWVLSEVAKHEGLGDVENMVNALIANYIYQGLPPEYQQKVDSLKLQQEAN